jgi:lactoylglutathione lyase
MAYRINHIHIKTRDPKGSADWLVKAFNFSILSDAERAVGDRFIRCAAEDGTMRVNFSSERSGETLPEGIVGVHLGLEHFGIDSADIVADIARLSALGAELDEGPNPGMGGQQVAFLNTPVGVRIELIQPPKA